MMGQPAAGADVLRRMNQESGGNPTAINRTDSNWQRGTPSVGLMQVIGPTYRAYKDARRDVGPYAYGSSEDPLSNTLASMHYALGGTALCRPPTTRRAATTTAAS
jgi:SLT domain-containing protein